MPVLSLAEELLRCVAVKMQPCLSDFSPFTCLRPPKKVLRGSQRVGALEHATARPDKQHGSDL